MIIIVGLTHNGDLHVNYCFGITASVSHIVSESMMKRNENRTLMGATTLSITTFSITTLSIMILSITMI